MNVRVSSILHCGVLRRFCLILQHAASRAWHPQTKPSWNTSPNTVWQHCQDCKLTLQTQFIWQEAKRERERGLSWLQVTTPPTCDTGVGRLHGGDERQVEWKATWLRARLVCNSQRFTFLEHNLTFMISGRAGVDKIQKSNPIFLNQSNPFLLQSNPPIMNQIQSNPNPQIQSAKLASNFTRPVFRW